MKDFYKRILVRTIKKRMTEGERLDDILAGYTKLTSDEKEEIRKAISE